MLLWEPHGHLDPVFLLDLGFSAIFTAFLPQQNILYLFYFKRRLNQFFCYNILMQLWILFMRVKSLYNFLQLTTTQNW